MSEALTAPDWPKVGEQYVWEMLLPHAACGCEVTEVRWNNEEWWVKSARLSAAGVVLPNADSWNELVRFQEACSPFRNHLAAVRDAAANRDKLWIKAIRNRLGFEPAAQTIIAEIARDGGLNQ